VAAVVVESARAAREDAERLRAVMLELRRSLRANGHVARERHERAAAVMLSTQTRLARSAPSPWSGLVWRLDYAELERALVPVD